MISKPEISALRTEILNQTVRVGQGHRFEIRDPKPRAIFAPCFRERVLHHALMNRIGPVLDRALDQRLLCLSRRQGDAGRGGAGS